MLISRSLPASSSLIAQVWTAADEPKEGVRVKQKFHRMYSSKSSIGASKSSVISISQFGHGATKNGMSLNPEPSSFVMMNSSPAAAMLISLASMVSASFNAIWGMLTSAG
ncbi:MAG: hypothetical protein ACTFAL_01920 [Candidatus Electronema sp. V4]|uniref:hypothetical protein n=1 Tax=Candidatus Electronema sp. V4 TaxID=3454756 RepID=UPI0040553EAB